MTCKLIECKFSIAKKFLRKRDISLKEIRGVVSATF